MDEGEKTRFLGDNSQERYEKKL